MPETRVYTGELRDRPGERFLVLAEDDVDAGRFVTATLGEPASVEEGPPTGLVVRLRDGRATETVVPLGLGAEAMTAR